MSFNEFFYTIHSSQNMSANSQLCIFVGDGKGRIANKWDGLITPQTTSYSMQF